MKPIRYTKSQVALMARVLEFFDSGLKPHSLPHDTLLSLLDLREQKGGYVWIPR